MGELPDKVSTFGTQRQYQGVIPFLVCYLRNDIEYNPLFKAVEEYLALNTTGTEVCVTQGFMVNITVYICAIDFTVFLFTLVKFLYLLRKYKYNEVCTT